MVRRDSKGAKALCCLQVLLVLATVGVPVFARAQLKLHVSPQGNDAWNGLAPVRDSQGNGPKRTLFGARNAVRAAKAAGSLPAAGARVFVQPGRYQHISTFDLTAVDDGTPAGPIAYISTVPGGAVLDGGRTIHTWHRQNERPNLGAVRADVRPFIRTASLPANGIGEAGAMGHSAPNFWMGQPAAELFFEGQRMTLARFPNEGYIKVDGSAPGNGFWSPRFRADLAGMRTPSFKRMPGTKVNFSRDGWIRGVLNERLFFTFQERVRELNVEDGQIEIMIESGNTMDPARRVTDNPLQDGRFYYVNSLFELDSPGEYYVDRDTLNLYFYPPATVTSSNARLTMARGPVVRLRNVKNVTLDGFAIEGGREDGVYVENARFVLLRGLTIRNVGGSGVEVRGGRFVTVQSCRINEVGEAGIDLEGGDRSTLQPAGHLAQNNHVFDFGQNQPAYRPGLRLWGCGITARNNTVHGTDHIAVWFFGNDNLIERNEVFDAVNDTADLAAINTNHADWTCRGNVLRENHVHGISVKIASYHINHGLYLDDMFSSALVERNVFRNVEQPVQFGGGHDNIARGNVFLDCVGAFRIDDRGLDAPEDWVQRIRNDAARVPWASDLWRQRYPSLYDLMTRADQRRPSGNEFVGNVCVRPQRNDRIAGPIELWGITGTDPGICRVADNTITNSSVFVNEQAGNLTPKPGSVLWQRGFQPIDMRLMGVQTDRYLDGSRIGWRAESQP